MRWRGRRQSANVEDRRRIGPLAVGGGITSLIVILLVAFLGGDVGDIPVPDLGGGRPLTPEEQAVQDELAQFVGVVLADTEDVWKELFRREGRVYEEPRLVLFSGSVGSACGYAGSAMGPFYCPPDHRVYIDLSFFQLMRDRFRAAGDFAQAYVIAHEVGHHVQNLLGITDRLEQARAGGASRSELNALSVRLELQADFLAGVWAHHAERTMRILEEGDVEEALAAAHAIGDDTLQRQGQGRVVPDSFTHGTSAQRVAWFRHGLRTGDLRQGNTFDDAVFERISPP